MNNKAPQIKKAKLKFYGLFLFIVILTLTLLILPAGFFDNGQSICISMLLLNKECYGCGMTRAFQHILHLDFETAYHYNKLSFLVFPLFVFMILWELRKRFRLMKESELDQNN